MHLSRIARLVRSGTTLILGLMCGLLLAGAHAAELGEAVVRSYSGQPLVADVELSALAEPGTSVQVRLADPDVWRGANVRMHPVLSNLSLTVMRRDGRQFLHITSLKPVEGEYLHLFLTLGEGARREVRALTLWLSPDPAPPPPAPLAETAPAPLPAAPVRTEPAKPAVPLPHTAPVPVPVPVPRPVRVLQLPSAAPAACARIGEEQLKTCADLDRKNGVLSARIVELEEKVKLLQGAIEGKHAAASHGAASASQPATSASPEAASAQAAPPILSRAALAKKNAAKKGEDLPWMLAGAAGGAVLATGLAVWFLLRRRKRKAALAAEGGGTPAPATPGSGMFAGLAARFKRKPKAPAAAPHVEPGAG